MNFVKYFRVNVGKYKPITHQKNITKKHINKKNKNPANNLVTVTNNRTFTSNKK